MTAGCLCHSLHFIVGGLRPAHADVFPDRDIEQEIILGDIADKIHYLFRRQVFHIHPADGDTPAACVPVGGDEFGDGGFAGAGRPHQRSGRALPDVQRDAVQNLLIFVSECHIPQVNVQPIQFFSLRGPLQIRLGQHSANFPGDGRNFGEIIGQKDRRYQWPHDTEGQDCNRDKIRGGQTAIPIKDTPNGQNADQHSGPNGHHQGGVPLRGFHPVQHEVRALPHGLRELAIGCCTLVERFYDLNAVDVLHRGGAHVLASLDHSTILFRVLFHLGHVTKHPDGDGDKRYQRHAPVQEKEVDHNSDRDQQIRGHFRNDVGQRDLHLFHTLHHGCFQAARWRIGQIAHGNAGQLIRHSPPQFRQHMESGFMGASGGDAVKNRLEQIGNQGNCSPGQINRKVLFTRNKQVDHSCHSKVWYHPAGHAENSKNSGGNKTRSVRSDKCHQTKWLPLFLHRIPPTS